jgi:CubicO group peptidase (beta-lactamase class C family)
VITWKGFAGVGAILALLVAMQPRWCRANELTSTDLEPWLDGLMNYAISTADIAGGVVVVVKNGEVLVERGYGFRDVARRLPMDPKSTVIRPGSISKLLTWTAVMQQVERGRLDLDVDINRYLDFKIPAREGKPVTLRQIMTHTAGFEESLRDLGGQEPPAALGAYLRSHLPERIYPPGTIPAYSNYAAALAGYIVARVTAQSFEDYMDQQVLRPLNMAHSSFRQPVPAELAPALSNGYRLGSGAPQFFEYIAAGPAGSLSSTADDMTHFMIAHLQDGVYRGTRILQPQTAAAMHAIQPKIYPALNGMALGFYETSRNGYRVLAHNGGTLFFHSDLHLFMDDDVGIFISLNSAGTDEAVSRIHDELFHGFTDRYFPASHSGEGGSPVAAAVAIQHARLISGAWENSRRSATSFLSLAGLLSPLMITANDDGTVTVPVPSHGDMRWHEIAPFVWEQVGGVERMQAVVIDGQPAKIGFGMAPPAAFLPTPAYRSPSWILPALGIALLILLLNAIFWPLTRNLRISSLAAATVILSFPATLLYMAADGSRLFAGADGWIYTIEALALLVLPAASVVAALQVRSTWIQHQGWPRKIGCVAILASDAVLLWVAVVFHLCNFNTHY